MNSIKTSGRIVGVLFLLTTIIGGASISMRGLSTSLLESSTLFSDILENATKMQIAILMDLVANGIALGVAIFLYPILKPHNKPFAMGYLGIWIVQFAIIIASNISHLSLFPLSQEFVNASSANTDYFKTLAMLRIEDYFSAHFLSLIIYSAGAFLLYAVFFQGRLIPRIISVWGMVAVTIVFTTTWFQIFDQQINMLLYGQNGIFLIVLTLWLIIKGFNSEELAPTN